jgi:hypothetical protein
VDSCDYENTIRACVISDDGGFLSYNDQIGLVKRDSSGYVQWTINREDGGFIYDLYSMDRMNSGNIIMAGANPSDTGSACSAVQIITQNGEVLWSHDYVFAGDDWSCFTSVRATADGGAIVGGAKVAPNERVRGRILRINAEQDTLFSGLTTIDWGLNVSVAEAPNGYIALCGFGSSASGALAMFDPAGNLLWNHGGDHSTGWAQYAVVALEDNTFTVYEYAQGSGDDGGVIYNTSNNNSLNWRTIMGPEIYPYFYQADKSLIVIPDGGYAVCGYNSLAKTDPGGAVSTGDESTPSVADGIHISAYPNPCRESARIAFSSPDSHTPATIEIYNVRGQRIRTLVDRQIPQTGQVFVWDTADENGKKVASGVYLCRVTQGTRQNVQKILYQK